MIGSNIRPKSSMLATFLWLGISLVALTVAGAVASSGRGAGAFLALSLFTIFGRGGGAATVAGAVAVAIVFASALAFSGGVGSAIAAVVGSAVAVAGARATEEFSTLSVKTGRQGTFLSLFLPSMSVAAFVGVFFLASLTTWFVTGPLLLILAC